MKKDEIYWIDRGWQPVFIGFCPNKKAWDKFLTSLNLGEYEYEEPTGAKCHYLVNEVSGDDAILITISKNAADWDKISIIGMFAHEAVHAFDFVCEAIGEENPSKEFKAYAVQAILQEMLNAYDKTRCNGKFFE